MADEVDHAGHEPDLSLVEWVSLRYGIIRPLSHRYALTSGDILIELHRELRPFRCGADALE